MGYKNAAESKPKIAHKICHKGETLIPLLKSKAFIPAAEAPLQTGTTSTPTPEQLGEVATVKAAVKKAAASEVMTKAEWSAKDRRISRQGLFQSCLGSVGLLQLNVGNDLASYLAIVKQAAEEGLKWVNETE